MLEEGEPKKVGALFCFSLARVNSGPPQWRPWSLNRGGLPTPGC